MSAIHTPKHRIGELRGRARPTPALRRRLGILRATSLDEVLDNEIALDALARLLTEAIETRTTKDGRIDMRDVAAHVLAEMRRSG